MMKDESAFVMQQLAIGVHLVVKAEFNWLWSSRGFS